MSNPVIRTGSGHESSILSSRPNGRDWPNGLGTGLWYKLSAQPVGWLATTVTLYDELEKDIRRAFPSIHQAVGKVLIRFPDSQFHQDIAKTVAVLQILGNLPVSVQNVASLMHSSVTAASQLDAVKKAAEDLLNDVHVPLGEKDGNLIFLSEKLRDIEQERGAIALRAVDVKRIFNEALRESFDPLPRVNLLGTMAVTTGLKVQSGSITTTLAGDQNAVQTVVELVPASDYDVAKNRALDDSRNRCHPSWTWPSWIASQPTSPAGRCPRTAANFSPRTMGSSPTT